MITDRTITGEYFEFSIGGATNDARSHIGLHVIEHDGTRTTLAMPVQDAEVIGKLLVGHADAIAGRPPRDW